MIADAAARQEQEQRSRPAATDAARARARRPARSLSSVGTGWPPGIDFEARRTRSGDGPTMSTVANPDRPQAGERRGHRVRRFPDRRSRGNGRSAAPRGRAIARSIRRDARTPSIPARTIADASARSAVRALLSVGLFGSDQAERPVTRSNFLRRAADDLVGVVFRTELLELSHDSCERRLDVCDGALGKVGSLSLEALLMFEKLLSVELGERVLRAGRPRI